MVTLFTLESCGKGVYDITPRISEIVENSGKSDGIVVVSSLSPLTAIITIEYESRLLGDLLKLIDELPVKDPYLQISLFPRSIALPLINGDLELGSFQQVALLDLNADKGERRVGVTII